MKSIGQFRISRLFLQTIVFQKLLKSFSIFFPSIFLCQFGSVFFSPRQFKIRFERLKGRIPFSHSEAQEIDSCPIHGTYVGRLYCKWRRQRTITSLAVDWLNRVSRERAVQFLILWQVLISSHPCFYTVLKAVAQNRDYLLKSDYLLKK